MILPMSLVGPGFRKMNNPLGVGREVGNDRTHQKRGIVIHGNANAEPWAQPDVEAAADRQRRSGIGMVVGVADVSFSGEPCTGEQQHPSREGVPILHVRSRHHERRSGVHDPGQRLGEGGEPLVAPDLPFGTGGHVQRAAGGLERQTGAAGDAGSGAVRLAVRRGARCESIGITGYIDFDAETVPQVAFERRLEAGRAASMAEEG